jgi:hypothetical protein
VGERLLVGVDLQLVREADAVRERLDPVAEADRGARL